ncbi:hypothetical protein VNO78_00621 [Psophocarpus tetragonolobus]|uniref:Uncharacterized protein n=1 Tax=Psophocarpus tetragonolobus TaxID=3891 RepID=A0AAN9T0K8_PSOTE
MAATCTGFFSLRSPNSNSVESRQGSSASGCGKFDGVAMWFINGVTAAFFASLNRCSCIRIATQEDPEDANDMPLMLNHGTLRHDAVVSATPTRRRTAQANTHHST